MVVSSTFITRIEMIHKFNVGLIFFIADQIVVTREYAVNAKKKFQRPAEVSPKEVDPSLFFVYYDENQI